MFDLEDDTTRVEGKHGMPLPRGVFHHGAFFSQHRSAGDPALVVKMEHDEAATQGMQQFESLWMPMNLHYRIRLHRNGETLHRIVKPGMEIQVGATAGRLPGRSGESLDFRGGYPFQAGTFIKSCE